MAPVTRPLFKRCRCGHTPMSHQDQAIHRSITCPLLRPLGASEGVTALPVPAPLALVDEPSPAQVRRAVLSMRRSGPGRGSSRGMTTPGLNT